MEETIDTQNVGEILRNARLKSGKTLNDVSKDLCIRKFYLEAIENVDIKNLPQLPYGLGFVRSYANYLNINAERVVRMYRQIAYAEVDEEEIELPEAGKSMELNSPTIRHIGMGIIGLILVILAWTLFSGSSKEEVVVLEEESVSDSVVPEPVIIEETEDEMAQMGIDDIEQTLSESENAVQTTNANNAENTVETETVEPVVTAQNKPIDNDETTTQEDVRVTPTRVQMVLSGGPSWLEVRHGKKVLISGIFGKDFTYDVPDKKGIIVSVGRYYNVDFYVDGKLTKIASSMKQTNISLDKYLPTEE